MHLSLICVIGKFIYRLGSAKKYPFVDLIVNVALAALMVAANIHLMINWKELYISPFMEFTGLLIGLSAIFILLELTRRTVGLSLAVIVLIFLVYAYFGNYIPGFLGHRGYNLERIVVQVFAGTEGIYGIPLGVCATIVIVFLLPGSAHLDWYGCEPHGRPPVHFLFLRAFADYTSHLYDFIYGSGHRRIESYENRTGGSSIWDCSLHAAISFCLLPGAPFRRQPIQNFICFYHRRNWGFCSGDRRPGAFSACSELVQEAIACLRFDFNILAELCINYTGGSITD
jgi:hypothetical protein